MFTILIILILFYTQTLTFKLRKSFRCIYILVLKLRLTLYIFCSLDLFISLMFTNYILYIISLYFTTCLDISMQV